MKMNGNYNGGKCPECGSTKRISGLSHYECDLCGRQLERLPLQHDFTPEQTVPRELRKSTDRNSLGTTIDGTEGARRLRDVHAMSSARNPLFLDLSIHQISKECGTNSTSADAAQLLIEADRDVKLGMIRRRMRGTQGMGEDESREYRARAFAAASLHIRNSEGRSNTAPQAAMSWGLRYSDLARNKDPQQASKSKSGCVQGTPSVEGLELRQELERIRNFMSEQLDMATVNEIMDRCEDMLRASGEPLRRGDEWLTGPLCNTPSSRAAFEIAIRSMAKQGLPVESAMTLYRRLPIGGLSHMERTCPSLFENHSMSGPSPGEARMARIALQNVQSCPDH